MTGDPMSETGHDDESDDDVAYAASKTFIAAGESMLALARDMNAGLLDHSDAYYAVENFARYGTPYVTCSGGDNREAGS